MDAPQTRRLIWLPLAALLTGACGGIIDPSQNTITPFDGVLQPLGRNGHQFDVRRSGEVDLKITALSNADAVLRVSYGQGNCNNAVLLNAGFRQLNNIGVGGNVFSEGPHCAVIEDALGALSGPATYTLRVSHP
jgi:hypothetical protein